MTNIDFEMTIKKELRLKKKTIVWLSKQLDISTAYCSDILRGNRKAKHYKKKIIEILDLTINLEEE